MQIGLVLPTIGPGAGREGIDAALDAVVAAGWSSVWVTDHLLVPAGPEAEEYGTILEAVTTLAYVAGRGLDLRLGTSVVIPAMRHPVILAKQLATLDILTEGRVIAGVGVADAHDLPEFTNLGAADRFEKRGVITDETIRLWRHLWSGAPAPFHGEHHRLDDYVFGPLPPQGGTLPIWTGGRSGRALRRAGELADGYHAAQTGPDDLRNRLPELRRLSEAAARPMPTLSVRARIEFSSDPGRQTYVIHGDAGRMQAEVTAFAELGVQHLVVVLGTTDPRLVAERVRRFQSEVVGPALGD